MNRPAPDLCLNTLAGKTVCLRDLRGHPVLLFFWVTWCPACQAELPVKERFYRALPPDSLLQLYSVNVTGREVDPLQVEPFIRTRQLTMPVLRDDGRKAYDALGLTSVPSTVFIDTSGNIRGIFDETVPFMKVIEKLGDLWRP